MVVPEIIKINRCLEVYKRDTKLIVYSEEKNKKKTQTHKKTDAASNKIRIGDANFIIGLGSGGSSTVVKLEDNDNE